MILISVLPNVQTWFWINNLIIGKQIKHYGWLDSPVFKRKQNPKTTNHWLMAIDMLQQTYVWFYICYSFFTLWACCLRKLFSAELEKTGIIQGHIYLKWELTHIQSSVLFYGVFHYIQYQTTWGMTIPPSSLAMIENQSIFRKHTHHILAANAWLQLW